MSFYDMDEWTKAVNDAAARRALEMARDASQKITINTLNAENRKLRTELTVATVAAQAANDYYLCEYVGTKTYRLPSEIREAFADAIENYRQATGMTGVEVRNG